MFQSFGPKADRIDMSVTDSSYADSAIKKDRDAASRRL